MGSEFINWLTEIGASFDGSDFIAFIGGVVFMICWKNVRAMIVNRSSGKRKINLPKMNAKILVWAVVVIAMVGVMWSTLETGNAIRQNVKETKAVAIAVCENAKVSGVERKALQDLLIASMNAPEAKLPVDDPVRKEWGQKLGLAYLATLDDAAKQRQKISRGEHIDPNFWERYFGPDYPEPDCVVPVQ